ncbi:MAG: hypothetical protein A3B91_03480 [Candidatus Yanofskybacteria bacterium RIFCSPHIGHO2_02_FULL_41_29]|uniref:Uncharacterized protein n=1 Tax=Candidatus Yanofskybacteria bacterium RIFCSPHIGHO2_01_FULL_41_53 TaxID=1802663 RepID=A0A1F8EHN8_9BACT|nr:MAG: hypothetical protein A2650_02340 [Candidatus Yanofskybacteria bacterium RIFCSPHIGHO2_01_FULL_41_53]OGN10719.1 MAG: hypothetical protein A3B91_03480 [Candidatus Yanofskybacteria bacterium RIFCSPHIGHO2_02_FULL_41_29]OGN21928.1 MAG: hypothetical protein A2916_05130 [Candidatus Yanofskybacteria bacterium RIFCSPLOWO2_01_FULL_41_67]OGN30517.1 MAG: hypothetical protein A3H54_00650 [Candidatus Yanofskybacteria bacterium RIFCSPLOWO2_02_FULL_41_13]
MPKFEKPPKYVYSFETDDGFPDLSQIFDRETHHLSKNFISTMARFPDKLRPEVMAKGEKHLWCKPCKEAIEAVREEYKEPEQQLLKEE